MAEDEKITAEEVARRLGVQLEVLLEQFGTEKELIEKFKNGELQLLND